MIVNLPGKIISECNQNYQTHTGAMPYNTDELNNFYKFAIKKINLSCIKKETENKETNENKDNNKQTNEDNLENIF